MKIGDVGVVHYCGGSSLVRIMAVNKATYRVVKVDELGSYGARKFRPDPGAVPYRVAKAKVGAYPGPLEVRTRDRALTRRLVAAYGRMVSR